MKRFQFTRPAWGATITTILWADLLEFQFTRPAWGATRRTPKRPQVLVFQFTRPAWGATDECQRGSPHDGFNSRAPRGARRFCLGYHCALKCFNSRAPRGARRRNAARSGRKI